MINRYALESVRLLATKLADANVRLGTLPGPLSRLHSLSDMSAIRVRETVDAESHPVSFANIITAQVQLPYPHLAETPHTHVMDDEIATCAEIVLGNLHIARNIVNPICVDIAKRVHAAAAGSIEAASSRIFVNAIEYAKLWSNPVLATMLSGYEQSNAPREYRLPMHPTLSAADIRALLTTGSKAFDTELTDALSGISDELLSNIVNSVFSSSENPYRFIEQLAHDRSMASSMALLILFIIASVYVKTPPEGVNAAGMNYGHAILDVRSHTAISVLNVMRRRERDLRLNSLIIKWPSSIDSLKAIEVNGDVYAKWLADGGAPELLFGSYFTDKEQNCASLLAKRDVYIQKWNEAERGLVAQATADRYAVMQRELAEALFEAIRGLSDDWLVNGSREPLIAAVRERLPHTTIRDLDNLPMCVRHIVCHALFPQTNAMRILSTMDKLILDMPDAPVREIALHTAIDILAEWLASQITYEPVTA